MVLMLLPPVAEDDEVILTSQEDEDANTTAAIEGQVNTMQQMPLVAGVGAAIAGIIAFITLRKFR